MTDKKPSWARAGLIIVAVAAVLLVAGMVFSLKVSFNGATNARQDAARTKTLALRIASDETKTIAAQAQTDYASCLRVNKVIDGVYALADERAPSRKSAELILSSRDATNIQRASATTTIQNLDALSGLFHKSFVSEHCKAPPKETP